MTTTPLPAIPRPCGFEPGVECPPEPTFSEQVVDFLRAIGLSEADPVDSNTPLNIIRHLAAGQDYSGAIWWAIDWGPVLLLGCAYLVSKLHGRHPLEAIKGWFGTALWVTLVVYGWTTASVLLTDVKPLLLREFVVFGLWALSVAFAASGAVLAVEIIRWGGMALASILDWMGDFIGDVARRLRREGC